MKSTRICLITRLYVLMLFGLLISPLRAYLPQRSHILEGETERRVGVYRVDSLSTEQEDLFFRFQARLFYELQKIKYFSVLNHDQIMEELEGYYRNDPVNYFRSFDSLVLGTLRSNGMMHLRVYFPSESSSDFSGEFFFSMEDDQDIDRITGHVTSLLQSRLYFSGEVLEVLPGNRVLVNVGAEHNRRAGEIFALLSADGNVNALVYLSDIHKRVSVGKILYRHQKILQGDLAGPADSSLLMNFHSRPVMTEWREGLTSGEIQEIFGILDRQVELLSAEHGNSFLVHDRKTAYFIDPDKKISRLVERDMKIDSWEFHPNKPQVVYTTGNEFIHYDLGKDRKNYFVMNSEGPSFIDQNIFFSHENEYPVRAHAWDHDGEFLAFYVENTGLIICDLSGKCRILNVPELRKDMTELKIDFSGNNEELFVSYPNYYNDDYSVLIYSFQKKTVRVYNDLRSDSPFNLSPDYQGLIAFHSDDDKVQTVILNAQGMTALNHPSVEGMIFSADNQISAFRQGGLSFYSQDNSKVHNTGVYKPGHFEFFPSSDILVVHAFIKDTNADDQIDWKDKRPIFIYSPERTRVESVLVDDADEFFGISASGEYVFFRKGERLFCREIESSRTVSVSEN